MSEQPAIDLTSLMIPDARRGSVIDARNRFKQCRYVPRDNANWHDEADNNAPLNGNKA